MQTKRWPVVTGSVLVLSAACGGNGSPSESGLGLGMGTNSAAGSAAVTSSATAMLPAAAGAGAAATSNSNTAPLNRDMTGQMPLGSAGRGMTPPAGMAAAGAGAVAMTPSSAAGSPATAPVDPASCPPAPDGSSDLAVMALGYLNSIRLPAGAGCVKMVTQINMAAENHCKYYTDPANDGMCNENAHNEVMGCAGFTGTGPGQRMAATGYMARGGGEVMAFVTNPKSAIDTWVNSVWHRIPLLDPWTGDMGYGSAAGGCDTIDFGNSATGVPATTVLVYPYDGQTDVPTSFNGQYEGPTPPAPPSGWPSASPINLYARMLNVTEHVLTKDGDPTPIEHTWITGSDPMWGNYLRTSVFMYAHTPFEANTKYHVSMKGTSQAGALDKQWTFTTGAAPAMWGGGRMRP